MARIALNKASLSRQARQLRTFERFLPSLDMKRRQLLAEQAREQAGMARIGADMDALRRRVAAEVPMLANREIALRGLVVLKAVELAEQNLVGTCLPSVTKVEVEVADYGYLGKPHWVDRLVDELTRMLEYQVRLQVQQRRVALLDQAVRKVTQRVNLFEKVLIPQTKQHIRRIRIYLGDAERAAVVRSKIAKRNRALGGIL